MISLRKTVFHFSFAVPFFALFIIHIIKELLSFFRAFERIRTLGSVCSHLRQFWIFHVLERSQMQSIQPLMFLISNISQSYCSSYMTAKTFIFVSEKLKHFLETSNKWIYKMELYLDYLTDPYRCPDKHDQLNIKFNF